MEQETQIPLWLITSLSHYSKQQIAVALTWAYRNLPSDLLEEYYEWALWYRPAYNREIQDLVDRIGLRLEAEKMGFFQNGMGQYLEQAPNMGGQNLGYFTANYPNYGIGASPTAYGGNLNVGAGIGGGEGGTQQLGTWGFDTTGLVSYGVGETGIAPQTQGDVNVGQGGGSGMNPTDWTKLVGGIINQGAATAGSVASAYSKINCAANPCTRGCPSFGTAQCGTTPSPSGSGLFTPGGQNDYYMDPRRLPGAPGPETAVPPRAPVTAPTAPARAPAPPKAPTKILGIEVNATNVLLAAVIGIGAYYLFTRKK